MKFRALQDPNTGIAIKSFWTSAGGFEPAPSELPTEVKIHGQKYRVWYHTDIYSKGSKDARIAGGTSIQWRTILVDPALPRHMVLDTLYHEMMHVYMRLAKDNGKLLGLSDELEEQLCAVLAPAILDILGK